MQHIKDRRLANPDVVIEKEHVYMASPERSYVVKTAEKINYKSAYRKNPSRFIEKALN